MTTAPDYVEPVEGWRVWVVVPGEQRLLLRSLFYRAIWYPDTPFRATCMHRDPLAWLRPRSRRPRPCPDEECGCGIHASRSPRRLVPYLEAAGRDETWRVIGTVALWGEVVECEKGWRAATGYPTHLYVPDALDDASGAVVDPEEIAAALAAYHVPVDLFSPSLQELVA